MHVGERLPEHLAELDAEGQRAARLGDPVARAGQSSPLAALLASLEMVSSPRRCMPNGSSQGLEVGPLVCAVALPALAPARVPRPTCPGSACACRPQQCGPQRRRPVRCPRPDAACGRSWLGRIAERRERGTGSLRTDGVCCRAWDGGRGHRSPRTTACRWPLSPAIGVFGRLASIPRSRPFTAWTKLRRSTGARLRFAP